MLCQRKDNIFLNTMRFQNEQNRLYYAYVNNDFNRLETMPQILFEYPDKHTTAIDGDITEINEKYYLTYVPHENGAGIKLAVSSQINGDYEFSPRWIDLEPKACEAPNVWKRIGEDKWVLMYDCYGIEKHNFGFVETSDFFRPGLTPEQKWHSMNLKRENPLLEYPYILN